MAEATEELQSANERQNREAEVIRWEEEATRHIIASDRRQLDNWRLAARMVGVEPDILTKAWAFPFYPRTVAYGVIARNEEQRARYIDVGEEVAGAEWPREAEEQASKDLARAFAHGGAVVRLPYPAAENGVTLLEQLTEQKAALTEIVVQLDKMWWFQRLAAGWAIRHAHA